MKDIDLKSFKKVSEDEKTAVMQNDSGHKIHLVKSALSPFLQKKLSKLPLYQADPDSAVQSPEAMIDQTAVESPDSVAAQLRGAESGDIQNPAPGVPTIPVPDFPLPPPAAAPGAPTPEPSIESQYSQVPGESEKMAAAVGTGKAYGQLGADTSHALNFAADQARQYNEQAQADLTNKQTEIDSAADDIRKGHIKPNDYLENMGTVGKISTALGLILGGIGGGQMHQANPASTFLNSQIERNIEGQKADMENKNNLLSALHQQYGDMVVAQNMHRAIQATALANQLQAAQSTATTQLGKMQALNTQGSLKQEAALWLRQAHLAQMQGAVQQGGQGSDLDARANAYLQSARIYDPKGAEEFEKRYIPSVGVANVPLEPKDRETLQRKTELNGLLDRASSYLDQSGKLGPIFPADRAQGTGLQNEINLKMGQLDDLTRFTPEENKIYKQSVPDLTGTHFTGSDKALLQALKNNNMTSLNTFYKQKGLKAPAETGTAQVQHPNGTIGRIPKARLQDYLANGYKQVQ
jgi:hypothetical protein